MRLVLVDPLPVPEPAFTVTDEQPFQKHRRGRSEGMALLASTSDPPGGIVRSDQPLISPAPMSLFVVGVRLSKCLVGLGGSPQGDQEAPTL